MAVVAIAGDDTDRHRLLHGLHADNHGFLADIEVAEATDQAHAVELPRLFLEPAEQKHFAVGVKFLFLGELGDRRFGLFGGTAVRLVPALVFFAAAISLNSV
jgi:hypothetical protein